MAGALLLALALGAIGPAIPPLTGPVIDRAGVLGANDLARLEGLARDAREREGGQGIQLQYLLIPSLEGVPIEDYSIRVAEAWKLGTKGKDNGLLIIVAVEDRKVRIEVGGGLEGEITDLQSSRVIRNVIAPAFRQGRYGDGLYSAGSLLVHAGPATNGEEGVPAGRSDPLQLLLLMLVLFGFIGLRVFSALLGGRRGWRTGGWMGGGMRGGGRGWSGGGGGFSGGGSSGSW